MKFLCLFILFIGPLIGYGADNLNTFMEMQKPHYQIAKEGGMSDSELCFLFPFLHHEATKKCSQEIQKIYVITSFSHTLKESGAGLIKGQEIIPLKEKDLMNTSYLIVSSLMNQGWNMEEIITITKPSSELTPLGSNIENIVDNVQKQLTNKKLK